MLQKQTQCTSSSKKSFFLQAWPNAVVYYDLDTGLENDASILQNLYSVMRTIELNTCVRFLRKPTPRPGVIFQLRQGSNVTLGFPGNTHQVKIKITSSSHGHILHHIMHILGVYIEFYRPDANRFLIEPVQSPDGYPRGIPKIYPPYSPSTIMHYPLHPLNKTLALHCEGLRPKKGYNFTKHLDYDLDRIRAVYSIFSKDIPLCSLCDYEAVYYAC